MVDVGLPISLQISFQMVELGIPTKMVEVDIPVSLEGVGVETPSLVSG